MQADTSSPFSSSNDAPAKAGLGESVRRMARDPLTLFLLAGAAIFGAYYASQDRGDPIRYTPSIHKQLIEDYKTVTGKEPSEEDRTQMRDDFIGEELLFREALARGLHLNDGETRERMIDRLRYIVVGAPLEPTEEQLIDYYASHSDLYQTEPGYSFDQVFFNKRPENSAAILAKLTAGETVDGDDFWLGHTFPHYGDSMTRGMFGQPFLDGLAKGTDGEWMGPIESPRGWHFYRRTGMKKGARIPYETARGQVRQDVMTATTRAALDAEADRLKGKFDVEIVE